MKYDDALWHYRAEFPRGFPKEFGGTHIGLFLRWCFTKGWAGEKHLKSVPTEVQKVVEGSMMGTDFLFRNCGGRLTDEDLSGAGNHFTEQYYADNDWYLSDYTDQFGDCKYRIPEQDHNFEQLCHLLESRLTEIGTEGVESVPTAPEQPVVIVVKKPWWKFW